ncbi:unnamed protein product [Soboliphyme baturini]|uniref:Nudix hydrolase domain-containing protein n=1 Tax=Soboliphyme baturini TaxID=241478 RepID=A0A183II98_9BILA|nr:unnamed protein product [Soboliphyme baturini]
MPDKDEVKDDLQRRREQPSNNGETIDLAMGMTRWLEVEGKNAEDHQPHRTYLRRRKTRLVAASGEVLLVRRFELPRYGVTALSSSIVVVSSAAYVRAAVCSAALAFCCLSSFRTATTSNFVRTTIASITTAAFCRQARRTNSETTARRGEARRGLAVRPSVRPAGGPVLLGVNIRSSGRRLTDGQQQQQQR